MEPESSSSDPKTEFLWAVFIALLPYLVEVLKRGASEHPFSHGIGFATLSFSFFAFSATAFVRALYNGKERATSAWLFMGLVLQMLLATLVDDDNVYLVYVLALVVSLIFTVVGTFVTWLPGSNRKLRRMHVSNSEAGHE